MALNHVTPGSCDPWSRDSQAESDSPRWEDFLEPREETDRATLVRSLGGSRVEQKSRYSSWAWRGGGGGGAGAGGGDDERKERWRGETTGGMREKKV